MYSGGKFYQGDTLLDGQWFSLSSLFDAITSYTNAIKWSCESLVIRSSSLKIYFGDNATQDINNLYVKKSDLIGLIPSNNNTAESLLVALILKILDKTNDVEDSVVITLFDRYVSGNKIRNTFLIELNHKATIIDDEIQEPPEKINPSNYDYLL